MRIREIARLVFVLPVTACASKPAAVSTSPLSQCPFNVLATVSNTSNVNYDVYYYDASKRSMLGEIAAGSTVTYPLPGEGHGRVSLFRPQGDGGGMPNERQIRIRIHCAGS